MGSGMRKAIFTEIVVDGLKNWHKNARHRLSKNGSTTSTRKSSNSSHLYLTDDSSIPDCECSCSQTPDPTIVTSSSSTSEIIQEKVPSSLTPNPDATSLPTPEITREEENPNIINQIIYDGEISFGSSWKFKTESMSKTSGEITSIIEEELNFDQ